MKKLFYLGLTALLMFFAFGSANAQSPRLEFSPVSGTELEFADEEEQITINCVDCEDVEDMYIYYKAYATKEAAQSDDVWNCDGKFDGDDKEAFKALENASSSPAVITKENPVTLPSSTRAMWASGER